MLTIVFPASLPPGEASADGRPSGGDLQGKGRGAEGGSGESQRAGGQDQRSGGEDGHSVTGKERPHPGAGCSKCTSAFKSWCFSEK